MLENFKQELQALLAKYPDVESISFKVTETVTRNNQIKILVPEEVLEVARNNSNGFSNDKKKEEKPLSPLEKVISPEMMAKIKANSSIE